MMQALYRAEWLKQRRRPLLVGICWSLLGIYTLTVGGLLGLHTLGLQGLARSNTPPLTDAMGGIHFASGFFLTLLICVVTAGFVAMEEQNGMVKLLVVYQARRWPLLVAKVLVLLTWLVLLLLYLLVFTLSLSQALAVFEGVGIPPSNYGLVWPYVLDLITTLLGLLVLAMAVLLLTLLTRSAVGGVLLGFIYSISDNVLSQASLGAVTSPQIAPVGAGFLIVFVLPFLKHIYPFLLGTNLLQLIQLPFDGPRPDGPALLPTWWNLLAVGLYLALFFGLALFVFNRRDIGD